MPVAWVEGRPRVHLLIAVISALCRIDNRCFTGAQRVLDGSHARLRFEPSRGDWQTVVVEGEHNYCRIVVRNRGVSFRFKLLLRSARNKLNICDSASLLFGLFRVIADCVIRRGLLGARSVAFLAVPLQVYRALCILERDTTSSSTDDFFINYMHRALFKAPEFSAAIACLVDCACVINVKLVAAAHVVAANTRAVAPIVGALIDGLVQRLEACAATVLEHLHFSVSGLHPVFDHLVNETGVLVVQLLDLFAKVDCDTAKCQAEQDEEA